MGRTPEAHYCSNLVLWYNMGCTIPCVKTFAKGPCKAFDCFIWESDHPHEFIEEDVRAGAGTEGTRSVTGHHVVNGGPSSQMLKKWN